MKKLRYEEVKILSAGRTKFSFGDRVRKKRGACWQGHVCGFYSTPLTPIGYAVASEYEIGSVQIYPESALEVVVEEVNV